MEVQSDVREERTIEPQRDVVHEAAPARPQRHRLLRGLAWGVGALGLIALGAVGAILGPRYLGGILPAPVATAPTSAPGASPPAQPAAASAPAAEVVLSSEAVTRAGITTAPVEEVASQATIQLPGTV